MNEMTTIPVPTTLKDWESDQEVRWCPGCGDYAILKEVQRTLPELGADPAKTVFVSGIGCSSRFPYYIESYGFHTIHGRAPAFATGIKLANPELDVWIVTGDGDGLSIGGNHTMHLLRRNLNSSTWQFKLRRSRCIVWLPPIESPSPSPVTIQTSSSGLASLMPVANAGARPWMVWKP